MNEGYKILGRCIEKEYSSELFLKIETACLNLKGSKRIGGSISGHLNCVLGEESEKILENIRQRNVIEEIASYFRFDPEEYWIDVGCNVNFPGSKFQHIHFDGGPNEEHFILNIPLIDIDSKNGAFELIPNSHHVCMSYLDYLLSGLSKEIIKIEATEGTGFIRSSRIWHRGTPNESNTIRPMIGVVFNHKESIYAKELIRDHVKKTTGKIFLKDNWYLGGSYYRELQEFIYVHLPFVHSFIRILKSLLGKRDF